MSIRQIAIPRSVALLLVVLFGAGLLSIVGTSASSVGAAPVGRPRPTATPTTIPTPTAIPTLTATPAPRCTASGSVIPSPNENDYNNGLNDVAAISTSDIWAVGSYGTPFEHWDGASWSLLPDPNAGGGTRLFGVAAVTSADVWAVGATIAPQGWDLALAEHWDGTTWSVIPGTTVGTNSKLSDVTALAANDVWAVGSYASPATNNWYQPLIEHWDGTAWSVVPSPSIGTSSELRGVAALTPNDIWAVGDTYATQYQTLVLHWYGAN